MQTGERCGRHLHAKRKKEKYVDDKGNEMYHGVKLGEYHRTDIQVAINEGNIREDAFFMIRVGKASTILPFQQQIPIDFARYHQTMYMEKVTLESPCGKTWSVQLIRPQRQAMRFSKGWRQFVVDNHIREGHCLIFTLMGKSHLVVKFFDNLGKSQVHFPPLLGANSHSQSMTSYHQHGGVPQPSSASPLELLCNVTKPSTSLAKPIAIDLNYNHVENHAKSLCCRGLSQHQSEVLQLQAIVPREGLSIALEEDDTFNAWNRLSVIDDGLEQVQQAPRAVAQGKNYINLDSDDNYDDDEDEDEDEGNDLSYLPTATKQNLAKPVRSMRNASKVSKLHSVEQIGAFSSKNEEIRRDDGQFTIISTPTCNIPSKNLEGRRGPVTRTTVVKKRPFRQLELVQLPSSSYSAPFAAATLWRGYHEVEDISGDGGRKAIVEGGFVSGGSRAMQLLEQQGCLKFSEIVSHCSRLLVSDQERSRVVDVAEKLANELENAKFVVVMRDAQVYHEFHLAIPQAILEATGTMQANKVKVFLTDSEKSIYVANWEWHDSGCDSACLSSDGWARFALDHAMEEGDVCVFELIDSGPDFLSSVVLHVHIFRVGDVAAVHPSSDIPASDPTSLSTPLEVNSQEDELMQIEGTKRPISDVHRLRLQKKLLKPRNLQPRPKVIKRGMQGHRALRQY